MFGKWYYNISDIYLFVLSEIVRFYYIGVYKGLRLLGLNKDIYSLESGKNEKKE